MILETDSRIVSAFQNSSFVSSNLNLFMLLIATKGRSHKLIRKREARVMEEELKEESKGDLNSNLYKDNQILILKKEIDRLKEELEANQNAQEEGDKYAELLSDLFNKGIIDSNGKFIKNDEEDQI